MTYEPLPDFYCKKHRYTPPENSGMAFCPMCEGLDVGLIDGTYFVDGVEIGNDPPEDLSPCRMCGVMVACIPDPDYLPICESCEIKEANEN